MLALRQRRVGGLRLRQRLGVADGDEGVQARVQRLDRKQMRHGQVHGGEAARAQPVPGFGDGQIRQHYSTTFGTAKNSPLRSGALDSTCSG